MASEIIGTIPEKTPKGWRQKAFFYNRRRQLVFDFDGGIDNTPRPAERVPDPDEIKTALREYLLDVANTGEDVLDELHVQVPWLGQSWQFRFRDWPGCERQGPLFVGARRDSRGPWLEGVDVPEPVRRYLGVSEALDDDARIWVCTDFDSLGAMIQAGLDSEFVTWQKSAGNPGEPAEALGVASVKFREHPDKIRRLVKIAAAERLGELDGDEDPHSEHDPDKEASA